MTSGIRRAWAIGGMLVVTFLSLSRSRAARVANDAGAFPGAIHRDLAFGIARGFGERERLPRSVGTLAGYCGGQRLAPQSSWSSATTRNPVILPPGLASEDANKSPQATVLKNDPENISRLGLDACKIGQTEPLVVVAWGHGGKQGSTSVFHAVRGPRITAGRFQAVGVKRRWQATEESQWILIFPGSGSFASQLAGEHCGGFFPPNATPCSPATRSECRFC